MTMFWMLALALMAVALALLLPRLLRSTPANGASLHSESSGGGKRDANLAILREQSQQLDTDLACGTLSPQHHRELRTELARRTLEEQGFAQEPHQGRVATSAARPQPGRAMPLLVGLGIPLVAIGLYTLLGSPQALQAPDDTVAAAPAGGEAAMAAQIEAMVAQLAAKLEQPSNPEAANPEAWAMLGRSYASLQRFADADHAYARAVQLAPSNAQWLADRADVLSMLQGQSAAGEPTRLIARALQLEPNNLKALALAGSAAFERQDYAAAVRHWQLAQTLAPAGSEFGRGLQRSLDAARLAAAPVTATASAPAPAVGELRGAISLAPALADRVSPGDTVFIVARAAAGPSMPLAVLRRKASDLPIRFTLDDSAAMSPSLRLSQFAEVLVSARVSRSGEAMPQSGDLVGSTGPVKPGTEPLSITINGVQP